MTRVTKESAGPKREVYLRLLRSGQILFGDRADEPGSSPMFELREPGCVYITGHLFAEYFGRGDIWLRGEGRIKAQAPSSTDGRVPASDFEAIEFEGDRPELECARTLLPVLFFGTMRRTSPIASPAELDPASRCAESVPWPAAGAQP